MSQTQNLQWDFQQNHESLIVTLSGELTRHTLLPLWKQRASFLPLKANQHLYWDLRNLTRIDSAGFALFADLLNHYHARTPNCVINVPDAVKTLADLFNLTDWFSTFILCEKSRKLDRL